MLKSLNFKRTSKCHQCRRSRCKCNVRVFIKKPCRSRKPGCMIYFSGFVTPGAQGPSTAYYATLGVGITGIQRPGGMNPVDPLTNLPLILPKQFHPVGGEQPVLEPQDIYHRVPRSGTLRNLRVAVELSVTITGFPLPYNTTVGIWYGPGQPDDNTVQFTPPALVQTPLTVNFDLYSPQSVTTHFISSSNTLVDLPVRAGDYIALVVLVNGVVSGEFTSKFVTASLELV